MNDAATNASTVCVSNTNLEILRFLKANPNSSINDIHAQGFYEMYPLHMELILLEEDGLIQTDPYLKPDLRDWISNTNYTISLSSKGVAYLDSFEREQQWRKKQIDPIKEIADSAKLHAVSAESISKSAESLSKTAKDEAESAGKTAWWSNGISAFSALIALVSLVFSFAQSCSGS